MTENVTQQAVAKRPSPVRRAIETLAGVGGTGAATRPATLVDVVNQRAFRAHAEALREYVTLRVGDVEHARAAFVELRARVATADAEMLVAAPGMRAQLFAMARRVALRAREDLDASVSTLRGHLPYRLSGAADAPSALLAKMRAEVPDNEAELLELAHARTLSLEEIACVVERPREQTERALEVAERRVRSIFGDKDPSRALREGFGLSLAGDGVRSPSVDDFAALAEGTIVGERYRIEAHVGSGAFGAVYRASDVEVPGHTLALKLLHQIAGNDDARAAALRELRNIAAVFHPSIVQFKDLGWYDGRFWFVMPWYEGETLETRIRRQKLTRAEAHRIFQPLARALAAMHAAGVRHQDIKPDNVFLARIEGFGEDEVLPVLLDLGVSATEAEMVIAGTPTYFAPEVAALFATRPRTAPISHKADVFSLALALRNALEPETEEDIDGGGVDRFIERRAEIAPAPPTSRDLRYLAPFFARALSLEPAERPDATELARSLDVLLEPERRRARIRSVLSFAMPLLAIAALATAFLYTTLTKQVKVERAAATREAARAENLEANLSESERARAGIANESERIERLLARGQASNAELSTRLSAAQRSLAEASERIAVVEKRTRIAMEELAAVRAREATTRQQLADTSTRLEMEHARVRETEQRLAAANADLDRARSGLSATQAALATANERVSALSTELARAESDLGAVRAERARLEGSLASATAEANRAVIARDEAVREAEQLRRRVRELEARGTQPSWPVQPAP